MKTSDKLNWQPEEDIYLSFDHYKEKATRRISRMRQRNHVHRKLNRLINISYFSKRRSVWADWDPEPSHYDMVPNGRISHAKNSLSKKFVKRCSNHVVRRTPFDKLPLKGKGYRKIWKREFDWWWNF